MTGAGGGIGNGGLLADDDDEGSPPVISVLIFFSSWITGLEGAGLFGGGGGPSGCFGSDFTVVSVVCCSVLNCGGGNLPVAHNGGGFVVFLPSSTPFGSSGGLWLRHFLGLNLLLGFFLYCLSQILNYIVNQLRLVPSSFQFLRRCFGGC